MRRRETPLKIQVMLTPCDDVVEIVVRGGAGQKQEDLGKGIDEATAPGHGQSARL